MTSGSDTSSTFFHCPIYKLLIEDIKSAEQNGTRQSTDDEESSWSLKLTHIPSISGQLLSLESFNESKPFIELDLKLVWIQGKVVEIEETENDSPSLIISDDDSDLNAAIIHDYKSLPGGDHPDIKRGAFVGAIGQIWKNDPCIILKATKVMYFSDRPMIETVWKDEVRLAKAFLAGLIVPSVQ